MKDRENKIEERSIQTTKLIQTSLGNDSCGPLITNPRLSDFVSATIAGTAIAVMAFPAEGYKKWKQAMTGCDLHLSPRFPENNSTSIYKNSYIFVEQQNQLKYMRPNGTIEPVIIDNSQRFKQHLLQFSKPKEVNVIPDNNIIKLTRKEINSYITSNGGHTHIKGKFHPFRGLGIFATNIIPTTAIQMTTDGYLHSYMQQDASHLQKLAASFYCGVQGALFATVVENCIVRQHSLETNLVGGLKDMLKHGWLRPWKSYSMIATRDGIFTAYMLWAGKTGSEYAKQHLPHGFSPLVDVAISIAGTAISHPFDMVGTMMQKTDNPLTIKQAIKDVIRENGHKGFYVGFLPRLLMFYTFGHIIPLLKSKTDQMLAKPCEIEETIRSYLNNTKSVFFKPVPESKLQPNSPEKNSPEPVKQTPGLFWAR